MKGGGLCRQAGTPQWISGQDSQPLLPPSTPHKAHRHRGPLWEEARNWGEDLDGGADGQVSRQQARKGLNRPWSPGSGGTRTSGPKEKECPALPRRPGNQDVAGPLSAAPGPPQCRHTRYPTGPPATGHGWPSLRRPRPPTPSHHIPLDSQEADMPASQALTGPRPTDPESSWATASRASRKKSVEEMKHQSSWGKKCKFCTRQRGPFSP